MREGRFCIAKADFLKNAVQVAPSQERARAGGGAEEKGGCTGSLLGADLIP